MECAKCTRIELVWWRSSTQSRVGYLAVSDAVGFALGVVFGHDIVFDRRGIGGLYLRYRYR